MFRTEVVDENEANIHKLCAQYGSLYFEVITMCLSFQTVAVHGLPLPSTCHVRSTWGQHISNEHWKNWTSVKSKLFQFSPFYCNITWCTSNRRRFTYKKTYEYHPCAIYCFYRNCRQKVKDFLSAFAKSRKATVGFIKSVRPHGTTRLPLDGFSWNLFWVFFSKICRENPSSINL